MYDYSALIVLPTKHRYFFEIALSDTPFPYEGVSVCAVTHIQGPLAYELQEKLIPNLIGQKLGTEVKKNAELRSNFAFFSY